MQEFFKKIGLERCFIPVCKEIRKEKNVRSRLEKKISPISKIREKKSRKIQLSADGKIVIAVENEAKITFSDEVSVLSCPLFFQTFQNIFPGKQFFQTVEILCETSHE